MRARIRESKPVQAVSAPRLTPKGRAMRESLLAAAAELFAELGYEQTRVADLVERARTSHGNFYRHFKDKDEVLLAALEPLLVEVRESSRAGSKADGLPTEAQFVERNVAFFRIYAKHRRLLRVMREAAARGPASSFLALWLEQRGHFVHRTERWLAGLQSRKLISDGISAASLAEALGSMTEQLAYVKVGLATRTPSAKQIDELGRTCGRIWYLALASDEVRP